jgi:hypothetical protein
MDGTGISGTCLLPAAEAHTCCMQVSDQLSPVTYSGTGFRTSSATIYVLRRSVQPCYTGSRSHEVAIACTVDTAHGVGKAGCVLAVHSGGSIHSSSSDGSSHCRSWKVSSCSMKPQLGCTVGRAASTICSACNRTTPVPSASAGLRGARHVCKKSSCC